MKRIDDLLIWAALAVGAALWLLGQFTGGLSIHLFLLPVALLGAPWHFRDGSAGGGRRARVRTWPI